MLLFGDLDLPLNASRGFVSISWASCFPRDVLHKRGVAIVRCPSGTFVNCIHKAEDIVKFLYRPGSPIIRLLTQSADPTPRGTPSAGAPNTRGGKNLRFSTEIAVYLENGTRLAHGCYGTLTGSHRWRIDQCRFQWPWVTLKGGTRGVNFFRRISLITLVPFDLQRLNSAG